MDEKIRFWFKGFEEGMLFLEQNQREVVFCECAKNCVNSGVLSLYQNLYNEVDGDINTFFEKLNDVDGVITQILEVGKKYNLYFEKCTCKLHTEGYVNSPILCECSRQSVIYVMNSLWNNQEIDVEICSTILRGQENCKFSIIVH